MEEGHFQDFIDFYQSQLFQGYYTKRGKVVIIPYLLFAIERLVELRVKKISVLDIGCGKGDLLDLLNKYAKAKGYSEILELHGLDYNAELLEEASKRDGFKLTQRDLRHDDLSDLFNKFDIVVSANTVHEVFSSLIGRNEAFPRKKFAFAKQKMHELFGDITAMLTEQGTLIFYDGLDIPSKDHTKKIAFKIKNPVLKAYLKSFIVDYSPWKISYTLNEASKVYEMNQRDFLRFVTTFKYLNSKLWAIERSESYSYFSEQEFRCLFSELKLIPETFTIVGNDLGIWNNNIQLVEDSTFFPPKAIMISATKKYLPSKYDYFVN